MLNNDIFGSELSLRFEVVILVVGKFELGYLGCVLLYCEGEEVADVGTAYYVLGTFVSHYVVYF